MSEQLVLFDSGLEQYEEVKSTSVDAINAMGMRLADFILVSNTLFVPVDEETELIAESVLHPEHRNLLQSDFRYWQEREALNIPELRGTMYFSGVFTLTNNERQQNRKCALF